jgi:hypothetical protein
MDVEVLDILGQVGALLVVGELLLFIAERVLDGLVHKRWPQGVSREDQMGVELLDGKRVEELVRPEADDEAAARQLRVDHVEQLERENRG